MVVFGVLATIILFVVADLIVRLLLEKRRAAWLQAQRRAALDAQVRLRFDDEAKSLKRVVIENPKARILAVDDEEVVLDSLRKILVPDGYSIDTVESGPEALSLVSREEYDFVFTDLKMPEMDGVEVTKGVKHLRPDADVIVITGYATVESAVETMKFGALDYVQKPFTEEELVAFVNRSLIRRRDRLEREARPMVQVVTASRDSSASPHEFHLPAAAFLSNAHAWVSLEPTGDVRVGLDDFALKLLGRIDRVESLAVQTAVKRGEPLFTIVGDNRRLVIPAPVSGTVARINESLLSYAEQMKVKPYELGWVCVLHPQHLSAELGALRLGAEAADWYRSEIERSAQLGLKSAQNSWALVGEQFLRAP